MMGGTSENGPAGRNVMMLRSAVTATLHMVEKGFAKVMRQETILDSACGCMVPETSGGRIYDCGH